MEMSAASTLLRLFWAAGDFSFSRSLRSGLSGSWNVCAEQMLRTCEGRKVASRMSERRLDAG